MRPDRLNIREVTIDRMSNSGNGIVDLAGKSHIVVKDVDESAVGEEMKVAIIDETAGQPIARPVQWPQSDKEEKRQISTKSVSDIEAGDEVQVRPERRNSRGNPIAIKQGAKVEIADEEVNLGTKLTVKITDFWVEESGAQAMAKVLDEENYSENKADAETPDSPDDEAHIESSSVTIDSSTDSPQLRAAAEENATEDVSYDKETTKQTSQYNRSSEVREYVMARADGQCEGCGEPAPFTSKTGDPYLHAHHVQELSEGGSDMPDTVIALCPNCHYRVHHGEDGDEYNRELKRKLSELENLSNDI